jgi:hypothetical protein
MQRVERLVQRVGSLVQTWNMLVSSNLITTGSFCLFLPWGLQANQSGQTAVFNSIGLLSAIGGNGRRTGKGRREVQIQTFSEPRNARPL